MTQLGYIEGSTRLAVSDTPAEFELTGAADESRNVVVVSANVAIHIERNADASTDSMRLPADTIVKLGMWGVDSLSFVKAAGAADGSLWITKTSA